MRILVVEDEQDLASAIAISLRRDGYAVDVANDGASAMDRVVLNEYDLLCLDLNLPDTDGLDLCRQVGIPGLDQLPGLDQIPDLEELLDEMFGTGEIPPELQQLLDDLFGTGEVPGGDEQTPNTTPEESNP